VSESLALPVPRSRDSLGDSARNDAMTFAPNLLGDVEPDSRPDPTPFRFPRRKLDDGFRTARRRRPPRPDVGHNLQHLTVAGQKDSVDREAHEEHVNRPRGPKQQPLPRLQRPPPKQPPQPRQRIVSDRTAFANDVPVKSPNRNLPHKRRPMEGNRSCAEPGFARRERKPASRSALNTTRGLAGGTGFPPRFAGKPRLPRKLRNRCECGCSGRPGRRTGPRAEAVRSPAWA
jgi:hypothetical protein